MAVPDDVPADLLDGLDGRAREERADLLHQLARAGVTEPDLRAAVDAGRLALLPVELVLRDREEEHLTVHEIAEVAGIEVEQLEAQRRAAGLPVPGRDERGYAAGDRRTAQRLRTALDAGIPFDAVVEMGRVFGESASRAAAAAASVVAEAVARPGDSERDVALRLARTADVLADDLAATLGDLARAHLVEQVSHQAVAAETIGSGRLVGAAPVTIAFADLVGFTQLGQRVDAEHLGAVSGRLTSLATDALEGPTRLVKTIGDAVMLAGPEADGVMRSVVGLLRAVGADDELPEVRAAMATGAAVPRYGDWYGPTVNLAARACGVARPGTLLVDDATREALEANAADELRFSRARKRRLKGIGEVSLNRLRVDGEDPGRD